VGAAGGGQQLEKESKWLKQKRRRQKNGAAVRTAVHARIGRAVVAEARAVNAVLVGIVVETGTANSVAAIGAIAAVHGDRVAKGAVKVRKRSTSRS
jgi:hypothetical protein